MTPLRWAARWTRNPRSLPLLGLGLSVLVHLALLVTLALPRLLPLPRLPIEVEILPAKKKPAVPPLQAPPPAAAPQSADATPPRPKRPPRSNRPRQGDRPDRPDLAGEAAPDRSRRSPPAATPGALVADDASVAVMLRMAALRTSPHRPAVEAFLDAFPDARQVAAGTDLQTPRALSSFLLDRIDGLLITTADVRLLSATVLIAVHDPDLDLGKRLSGRTGPPLLEPRKLVQAEPGLTVYAREDLLRGWLLDAKGRINQGLATRLRDFTHQGDAAVVAELRHLDRLVRVASWPTPTQLVLSLSAQARPAVRLHLAFTSEADARRVGGAWPALQERLTGQLVWLGLGGLLDDLRAVVKDRTVEVAGTLPGDDVDRLLAMLVALLPQGPQDFGPAPATASKARPNPDLGPAPDRSAATTPDPIAPAGPEPPGHAAPSVDR